jgi:excisionase family DNA binding protein
MIELKTDAVVVRPKKARELLNCSTDKLYQLINSGRLQAYKEGRATLITVASIEAHIADRLKHQALK